MPESVLNMLHARKSLIQEVGKVYFPPERFVAPQESIYQVSSPSDF